MNDQLELHMPGECPPASGKTLATVRKIVASVVHHFGVPEELIFSSKRTARVAEARQVAMTLVRRNTDFSLMEVGSIFNRDHGTVIHAMRAVDHRAEINADFATAVAAVMMEIRPPSPS